MAQLNKDYQDTRQIIEQLESRIRATEVSFSGVETVAQQLYSLIKVIDECIVEVQRERDMAVKFKEQQEILEDKRKQLVELERELAHAVRQIQSFNERVEKRKIEHETKMKEQDDIYQQVSKEWANIQRDMKLTDAEMDRMNREIILEDEQIQEIQQTLDMEVQQIADETLKLQDQLVQYVRDIQERLMND